MPQATAEGSYGQLEPSLFTVEVHSGNQDAKSGRSGYLVSSRGQVVTNYHVVAMSVAEPDRQRPGHHARTAGAGHAFDLVNDLALPGPRTRG